jgi:cytochrome P450
MSSTRIVVPFNHHSREFSANRTRILKELRTSAPVAYTESHGGHWVVSSYAIANIVLDNPEVFSSEKAADGTHGVTIPSVGPRLLPAETDPPVHTQIRKLLQPAYSPKALKALDAVLDDIITETIDRLIEKQDFDIVADVADVIPPLVGLRHLGFPEDQRKTIVDAIKIALKTGVPGEEAARAFGNACMEMMKFVKTRQAHPVDDVMSHLSKSSNPALSDEELMWLGMTLFVGGFKNPGAHISNMMLHLGQDIALRQRLMADRSLIPKATTEFLRFYSAGVSVARTATRDFELGGVQIAAGDRVLVVLPAANHDEAAFEDGESFNIDRSTQNRHLAFGGGPHYCVGFKLALIMFDKLMNQIFDRIPDYTVNAEAAVRVEDAGIQAGFDTIPASTGISRH